MGSIERIHQVAEHIIKAKNDGNQVVVVVSAMSGETNRLMDLAKQVDSVPTARELDVLLSAGEQVSMALLAMTLNKLGYAARSLTGAQANIVTDNQHNDATIKHIDTSTIMDLLEQDQIVIVAGFQGVNENGDITTLGRGGSDTSAVTLAGALCADECQIFTDVDGIYTCDPRVVKNAQKMAVIDFPSMEAMATMAVAIIADPPGTGPILPCRPARKDGVSTWSSTEQRLRPTSGSTGARSGGTKAVLPASASM